MIGCILRRNNKCITFRDHHSDIMCLYLGARYINFDDPIFGQGSGTSASFLETQTLFDTLAEPLSDLFYDAMLAHSRSAHGYVPKVLSIAERCLSGASLVHIFVSSLLRLPFVSIISHRLLSCPAVSSWIASDDSSRPRI